MRVFVAPARLVAGVALLLGLAACGSAHNADLFRSSGTLGEGGGASNASSAGFAPDLGGAPSGGGVVGPLGGSAGSSGDASLPPNGGATNEAGATAGGSYPNADAGGAALAGSGGIENNGECAGYDIGASYFAAKQHCYLVVNDLATYADAQAHCKTMGAHLVTIEDSAEDDFAWSLHTDEHWIGTSDGKGPRQPDPGTYTWVTGEPFKYTDWSSGQPNAADTDCGDTGITGHCYEHCGFQWAGGEHDGQWNDRFCLHTIASICEWDSVRAEP